MEDMNYGPVGSIKTGSITEGGDTSFGAYGG